MTNGSIPLHESQEVYGVSEDCKFNDHQLCHSNRCGCSCHRQARMDASNRSNIRDTAAIRDTTSNNVIVSGLDKYCPKCKVKAGGDQNYCKVDGSRLSSLRCPECNTPGDEVDNYCGYCGCNMKDREDKIVEAAVMGEGLIGEFTIPPDATITGITVEPDIEGAEAAMKAAFLNKGLKIKPSVIKPSVSTLPPGVFK